MPNLIRCIVADDEPLAVQLLAGYIQKTPGCEMVFQSTSILQVAKYLEENHCDLILLDIQMPELTGIQFLKQIKGNCRVIFTTAYSEYALESYQFDVIDYLLKPFNQERFDKAIAKWNDQKPVSTQKATQDLLDSASMSPSQSQRIVVKNGSKIKIIPVHDVFYLEAADDYVKIHTTEGYFLKNKTMSHFEQSLDSEQFVRSHRSYIVNVQQITRIDPYEKDGHVAVLRSGAKVPVSRGGYGKLKSVLGL